jgi:hypothetical protein
MKLPRIIQDELDRAPGRWVIEDGKKHLHILIDGRLAAIWPKNGGTDRAPRGSLNIRAQIRRHIKQFQQAAGIRRSSGTAAST